MSAEELLRRNGIRQDIQLLRVNRGALRAIGKTYEMHRKREQYYSPSLQRRSRRGHDQRSRSSPVRFSHQYANFEAAMNAVGGRASRGFVVDCR